MESEDEFLGESGDVSGELKRREKARLRAREREGESEGSKEEKVSSTFLLPRRDEERKRKGGTRTLMIRSRLSVCMHTTTHMRIKDGERVSVSSFGERRRDEGREGGEGTNVSVQLSSEAREIREDRFSSRKQA